MGAGGDAVPSYRRTNAKVWCKYCKVYIYDNKICRLNHDNGPQHKEAMRAAVALIEQEMPPRPPIEKKAAVPSFYSAVQSPSSPPRERVPVPLLTVRAPSVLAGPTTKRAKAASAVVGEVPTYRPPSGGDAIHIVGGASRSGTQSASSAPHGGGRPPLDVQHEPIQKGGRGGEEDPDAWREGNGVGGVKGGSDAKGSQEAREEDAKQGGEVKVAFRKFNKPTNLRR